jgi:hypothetical protein
MMVAQGGYSLRSPGCDIGFRVGKVAGRAGVHCNQGRVVQRRQYSVIWA